MAIAKICGLSTPPALEAALDGGAAFVGFNFFPASPRWISIEAAVALAAIARGRSRIVAVTVDPTDELLATIRAQLQPDFIQLHGAETPGRVAEVAALGGAGVIKVIQVREASDLAAADDYQFLAGHLMFDARAPAAASRPGGHGAPFDWSLLSGRRFARPWFLAGGLDPDNVATAIAVSGAPMVDVSSGVEGPGGLKDPALIGLFLAAAQASPRA
jgi:phosphoribosylanthranilate isomerase